MSRCKLLIKLDYKKITEGEIYDGKIGNKKEKT